MSGELQPAEPVGYRAILHRLTRLDAEAAELRAEAVEWHDDRLAAVHEAVRAAEDDVRAAADEVRRAQRDRETVDAGAADIWSRFVHDVGPSAERFGTTLPPPTVPRQRTADAEEFLQEASNKVRYVPPARPLGSAATLLFAAFGFLGGAVGVLAYQLLRWAGREAGGDFAVALPVLALIAMLLGPVLAVVAAKRTADHRGVGLDAAAVATVLGTGLATAGVLYAVLRGPG
ncbi:hypothetical protein [Jidongwangia harbinensis]|uniref:hypothetical protein n=1 Tax=Jidongwangia harbinensis TaxID=2878561 RepID=UPI001CD97796|nr:hypothetical protein [Jidongwangia harbinensis]MCA2218776.1 hypothetical protein [Jidongwangia harbinensis]